MRQFLYVMKIWFRLLGKQALKRRYYRRYFMPFPGYWMDRREDRLAWHSPMTPEAAAAEDFFRNASRLHIVRPDGRRYCHWFQLDEADEADGRVDPVDRARPATFPGDGARAD